MSNSLFRQNLCDGDRDKTQQFCDGEVKCENVRDSDADADDAGERAVLMIWLRFVRAAAAAGGGQLLVQRVMVRPSRQRCLMVQFIPPRCNGSHHIQM